MARRFNCATTRMIGSKNTLDSLRASNVQRGGTAVPLQIACWHLVPVCLLDEILRPGDGQEKLVHDKRSRKDDRPSSWIVGPLPGTASMTRHEQPDGCSQHAPTAARNCCHTLPSMRRFHDGLWQPSSILFSRRGPMQPFVVDRVSLPGQSLGPTGATQRLHRTSLQIPAFLP